jgi:hypothetical protein
LVLEVQVEQAQQAHLERKVMILYFLVLLAQAVALVRALFPLVAQEVREEVRQALLQQQVQETPRQHLQRKAGGAGGSGIVIISYTSATQLFGGGVVTNQAVTSFTHSHLLAHLALCHL